MTCYVLPARRGGEMVYATDLKSVGCKAVRVRVPPPAPLQLKQIRTMRGVLFRSIQLANRRRSRGSTIQFPETR